ncbi:MAG: hypothetical protein H0W90_02360 [Actinobacteria bacterium]|nr:hypothetical protein [Actinomycetota bacterium]
MSRRLLPALLVVSALLSDLGGDHGLALAILLCAIPAACVLALDCYADALGSSCSRARPVLAGVAVAVLVISAALRSPAVVGGVPHVAVSSLVLALLLYAGVAAGALLPVWRTAPESA